MQQLDLLREIIVDNFADGGGSSTGIEMATGLSVDIAINHDPAAIAMQIAAANGIKKGTVQARVYSYGWSVDEAITIKKRAKNKTLRQEEA